MPPWDGDVPPVSQGPALELSKITSEKTRAQSANLFLLGYHLYTHTNDYLRILIRWEHSNENIDFQTRSLSLTRQ